MHRTKTFSFVHLDSFIVYSTIFAFISIQYEERRKEKEGWREETKRGWKEAERGREIKGRGGKGLTMFTLL